MLPWAGYIRVSHVGKRGGESFHSPADQARQILAFCASRGHEVELLDPELNAKGGDPDRRVLLEAVDGVERGRYRGLLVAYQSRAMRDTPYLWALVRRLQAAGGEFQSATERIDLSSPEGRMQFTMTSAVDQLVREQHAQRFKELRERATAAGIWQRRQVPKGYVRGKGRKLEPGSDADLVRRAFRDRVAGGAMTLIARDLDMTSGGARALLRNRVYLGELKVGEYVNESAHEPLVDVDLFETAQAAMGVRPPRAMSDVALLAGLVRCTGCGHVMSRQMTASVVYSCHAHSSLGRCPAPAGITADRLDEHVRAIALREFALLEGHAAQDGTAIDQARAKNATAKRELAAYLEAVSADDVGVEAFAAGARKRRDAIDQTGTELRKVLAARAPTVPEGIVEAWPALSMTHRNRLLRSLIECVLVGRAGRGRIVAVEDRTRIIRAGAGIVEAYRGGGQPLAIRSIELPGLNDPSVLRP